MNTKLKALVTYLQEFEEDEIINQAILDNYLDDNNSHYTINDVEYDVLTDREISEALYDKAEEYALDIIFDFEASLASNNHVKNANLAKNALKEDILIDAIHETLSYEDEFECELVDEGDDYTIFQF